MQLSLPRPLHPTDFFMKMRSFNSNYLDLVNNLLQSNRIPIEQGSSMSEVQGFGHSTSEIQGFGHSTSEIQRLRYDEMVHVEDKDYRIFLPNCPSFRVDDFVEALRTPIEDLAANNLDSLDIEIVQKWFVEGVECQAMKVAGKRWQSGKVRFALEFWPEIKYDSEVFEDSEEIDCLSGDDVARIADKKHRLIYEASSFRIGDWMAALWGKIKESREQFRDISPTHYDAWIGNGVPSKVLKLESKQWQEGWIRLALEFRPEKEPDESPPPEPLDRAVPARVKIEEDPLEALDREIAPAITASEVSQEEE